MESEIRIIKIPKQDFESAIDIYTEAFTDDPLHVYLFPEFEERKRLTRLFYEMVVNNFVNGMNLQMKGVYENKLLAACLIYARPDALEWNDEMMNAVIEMRAKAKNEKVNSVGDYTMEASIYKPKEKHFYLNELAVGKNHRGKGFARLLIEEAEEDAKNFSDVKIMGLDTSNKTNVEIYKKIGFQLYKEFPFLSLTGYVMRKSIN